MILAGTAGLVVAVIAIARGSLPGLGLASRNHAAGLLTVSFILLIAGGALAVPADTPAPGSAESASEVSPAPGPPPQDSAAAPGPIPGSLPPGAQPAVVVRHVDGDTIWAEGGTLPAGSSSRIRLLQVDTPESTNRTDCYGLDAAAFTRAELPIGSRIFLLADREDQDRYGRFLRYIWNADGEFFNEKLARTGHARAVLYRPNDRYIEVIRAAEAEARAAGRGLWSACGAAAARAPLPAPHSVSAPPPPGGGCDASYPGVCIASSPPDLDCPEISHRRFQVVPPDPHGFDSDTDGVGCETG